jgi:NAD(P)-dependent dehydrogenase (short-subunit alcohol dehydrogenase family)
MNIIITGASRGIGRETAKALAGDKNNHILAVSRSEPLLRSLCGEAGFNNISYMAIDINEGLKDPGSLSEQLDKHFEKVDILINNAGALVSKSLEELSHSEIALMTETNFLSPLLLIKFISGRMREGSHIVNISSMGGFQGSSRYPGMSVYNASKAALSNLTESLAYEYEKEKISFNCLALGAVQTEMLNEAFPGYRAPLSPDEMASFISWFAINGNKFFNGKVLPVSVSNP